MTPALEPAVPHRRLPGRRKSRSGLLRISELARRAGVPRATVQFYVRDGLLPAPRKTARTMAYYDPACIDRIRLIKELQRRFLPLSLIRRLVDSPDGPTASSARMLASIAEVNQTIRAALEPCEKSLPRERVPEDTGVDADAVARLEHIGLVQAREVMDAEVFPPADVAILRAVGAMRRAGLTDATGFAVEDLAMYREALGGLFTREVSLFMQKVVGRVAAKDAPHLATAAVRGASDLIQAIRHKMVAEFATTAPPGPARQDVDGRP